MSSVRIWAPAAAVVLAAMTGAWLLLARDRTLDELSRVDPPPFVTLTERSGTRDAFESAMELYTRGDYAHAAEGLRAVVAQDPSNARARFYLGASELLGDQPEAAVETLQHDTIAQSAYAEHAHLLLAKSWLALDRVPDARRELSACIALNGPHAAEARELLEELRTKN